MFDKIYKTEVLYSAFKLTFKSVLNFDQILWLAVSHKLNKSVTLLFHKSPLLNIWIRFSGWIVKLMLNPTMSIEMISAFFKVF